MQPPFGAYTHSHYTDTLPVRRRRTRSDWAGISIADAFRPNLNYSVRLEAQRLFYRTVKQAQKAVAKQAGSQNGNSGEHRVSAQISPCYTTYPAGLAAHAAVGLTAFLEFKLRTGEDLFKHHLKQPLDVDGVSEKSGIPSFLLKKLAESVTRSFETKLVLEDLSRSKSLASIEVYRLFAAANRYRIQFSTVAEIINSIILYGDVLRDVPTDHLHPVTRNLIGTISSVSEPYHSRISKIESSKLTEFASDWMRDLWAGLIEFFQSTVSCDTSEPGAQNQTETASSSEAEDHKYPFRTTMCISPLRSPQSPNFLEPADLHHRLENTWNANLTEEEKDLIALRKHLGEKSGDEEVKPAIEEFSMAIQNAAGQNGDWEDMRFDLVEVILARNPFEPGPIQGMPANGHEIHVPLGDDTVGSGEIFDRVIELSDDSQAFEKLLLQCRPTIDIISRLLYPRLEQSPVTERFCPSGSLDPTRLTLGSVSDAIFKRNPVKTEPVPRGKALLTIACDGSASLDISQMNMLKILTCSWLIATARSDVQVLAGLYHSGDVRSQVHGALVEWMAHPKKTPGLGARDSARALITLPETGTGAQLDALSLAYIKEEARKISHNTLYYVIITDCKWNCSYRQGLTGAQEIRLLLKEWRKDPHPIHITMVALGVEQSTGMEELVDATIAISEKELEDYDATAQKIGRYVASCVAERNRLRVQR